MTVPYTCIAENKQMDVKAVKKSHEIDRHHLRPIIMYFAHVDAPYW